MELLERNEILGVTRAVMVTACDGHGRGVVFEGPAGIGKTTLLAEAAEHADDMRVACARPTELERTFAYGVARRLLQPLVGALTRPELELLRDSPGAAALTVLEGGPLEDAPRSDASQAIVHGLFWLLADVASHDPVLLVVDDAQWADDDSIAWLAYTVSRLGDTPVAVFLATRPIDPRDDGPLARLMTMRDDVDVVAVPPLTVAAVQRLIADDLGPAVAARAGERAARATGGNPFLLTELLRAWKSTGRAEELPVSLELRRAVAMRIKQSGDDAAALAEAVAILGGADVALMDAAALEDLTPASARRAADRLTAAGVLAFGSALAFVHPLVREAVYNTLAPLERAERHARAARLLADAGHPEHDVTAHLLAAEPSGDPWVVERLRSTAAGALARGAPSVAIELLRRALEEPPVGAERIEVLCELAEASARANAPDAEERLRTALAASHGRRAATVALTLGRLLLSAGRGADAYAVLTEVLPDAEEEDDELALLIRVELYGTVRAEPGLKAVAGLPGPDHDHPDLRGATAGERAMLASFAYQAAAAGAHVDVVRSLAMRALVDDRYLDDTSIESSFAFAINAALWANDEYVTALAHVDAALEHARRRGSATGYAMARAGRASALMRLGCLTEAEADALDALAIAAEHELGLAVPLALYPLICLRVDRGELDEAEAELRGYGFAGAIVPAALFGPLQYARGRVRLAHGRHGDAIADFLAAGAALLAADTPTPTIVPWRSDVALALAAAGEDARAAELVADELALAERAAAPRTLGLAVRAHALLGPADVRAERLRESVELLARSQCRVDLARALIDLGIALVRSGNRDSGRSTLREALDIADRQGAHAVAERAHTELAVAGARPRRRRIAGPDALTAAELRVARLAAQGRSNREIAAELFLSLKTVETHLSHVYLKLSVRRRGDLGAALQ